MKTEWDYSILADAYLKRPDYSGEALEIIFDACDVQAGQTVCDIGAGVAHLTLHLARKGLDVVAVEPNDNMRLNGIARTKDLPNVRWVEATGEETGQPDDAFDFVSFGSSFNVTDRTVTMIETNRILRTRRWFTCLWNHRVLDDPVQARIEAIIADNVDDYQYGSRREDQTSVIEASGLFTNVAPVEGSVEHRQSVQDLVEAWRSHGTLERQAKDRFPKVIDDIESYVSSLGLDEIPVPYVTRGWIAQRVT